MRTLSHEGARIRYADSPRDALFNEIRRRLTTDLDCVTIFTGPEGYGKSTLAYHVMKVVGERMGTGFSHEKIAYDPVRYIEIAKDLEGGSPILFDEAVSGLYNRRSMKKTNNQLNEFLYICRERNLFHGFCFPRFESLDLTIREHRAWLWFRIKRRGFAEVRLRNFELPPPETEEDAKVVFPLVGRFEFPKIETPEFEMYKKMKRSYVQRMAEETVRSHG